MKTNWMKWLMIGILTVSALNGCFVFRGGDGDRYRDRDRHEDRGDHHKYGEDRGEMHHYGN